MKFLAHISLVFLLWFNLVNASPVSAKIILRSREVIISKTEDEEAVSIVGTQLKNKFECVKKGGLVYLVVTADSYEEAVHVASKCLLGVDMTLTEWKAMYDKITTYIGKNWTDPYLHGQAAVFVASFAVPITKLSKVSKLKILNKLKLKPSFNNKVDDLNKIINATEEGKDIGKVMDDLASGAGKLDDALLDAAKAFDDNAIDVASVGFQNWKTFQNRVAEQLKNLYPGKKIGNQITLDVTYIENGVTKTKTIIPDNLIQAEVNGVKKYKVIDAKTANSDLINKADLTSTCTPNQQTIYPLIDGTANGSTITKVEMRGKQATDAFGFGDFLNGKAQIQLETGVEFWVNSSTTDFTQYAIRQRIK